MNKLAIYIVPVALLAAPASAAPSSGWGGIGAQVFGTGAGAREGAPLVLVQRRGGGNFNPGNVNRGNVHRGNFNSANFHRDVSANRNVSVSGGGYYGPNWGGVAAGAAVGVGVAAMATTAAAASSAYYPPPPPYQYYPPNYGY
jgi:hypothetical protein